MPDGDRDDLLDGAGELPDASPSKFDAAIGAMKKDGSLNALIAKWFKGQKGFD